MTEIPEPTQVPGFRGPAAATEPEEAQLRRGALGQPLLDDLAQAGFTSVVVIPQLFESCIVDGFHTSQPSIGQL